MADQDERTGATGARHAASVGIIHVLPHDEASVSQVLGPALSRIDPSSRGIELLVLTPDADVALAFSRAALDAGQPGSTLIPVTSTARSLRVVRGASTRAIAGPPGAIVGLLQQSAVKLDGIRTVIVAWADEILAAGEGAALETVMAELPKDASRVLVTAALSDAVEEIAERYLRRAHRLAPVAAAEPGAPIAMSYVASTHATRPTALRRVLDDLDPPSAVIYARTGQSAAEVRAALRELGYADDEKNITVSAGEADPDASLIILYDLPSGAAGLRELVGEGQRKVVALARPRDVRSIATMAGIAPTPLTPREPAERAKRREDIARDALRTELRKGVPDLQLLALEPLLDEFDGIEIAAAALRLLDRARAVAITPNNAAPASSAQPAAFVRLFMTVGSRDNVRPGDLVGMITAQGGITSEQLGRIEVRDTHSLVEVAASAAERVAAKISGTMVKGRRIIARPERPKESRPGPRDDRPRTRDRREPRERT